MQHFASPASGRHRRRECSGRGLANAFLILALSLSPAPFTHAQAGSGPAKAHPSMTPGEARAERAVAAAKSMGAGELYALLKPMPKGGDLHVHLSGAVYAETFLAEAVREGGCVDPATLSFSKAPEGAKAGSAPCGPGRITAAEAVKNGKLYDGLIDSFSMRGFHPAEGFTGHDQFFFAFDRFGGLKVNAGEWVDEVASRAAAQNEQYLELMQTPAFAHAAELGNRLGWPAGAESTGTPAQLARLREALLAGGLRDEVATDRQQLDGAEVRRRELEHCTNTDSAAPMQAAASQAPTPEPATPEPATARPPGTARGSHAACSVQVRWIYQVLRGFPPQQVFAQTLLGFEVASADPSVVGINFVMPEDGRLSMQDYGLQMQMLDFFHTVYPKVHISLHAGELAPGLVPPQGLSFHIREAVELGHAERIGHGVDVLYEDRPEDLLREMASRHIMVEINLTSNAVILGVKGTDHPLAAYRAAGVPVALSTDDEGVSRIDLTHEFVRAVEEQNLDYAELKKMARTSLEHSFLSGESLWAAPDEFTRRHSACTAFIRPAYNPSVPCAAFLAASERAAAQYELERRFWTFENSLPPAVSPRARSSLR